VITGKVTKLSQNNAQTTAELTVHERFKATLGKKVSVIGAAPCKAQPAG
jgi:hypothetical protein